MEQLLNLAHNRQITHVPTAERKKPSAAGIGCVIYYTLMEAIKAEVSV
jgi:hypothetical protein